MDQDDSLLVTSGYSFGDQHINEILFDSLANRARSHVLALQYLDPEPGSDLVAAAERRSNLMVVGPTSGWIGGRRAPWRLLEPVDDSTARFMDLAFDSDAEPDPEKVSLTGRFKLGDFNWLSRFLLTLTDFDRGGQ